MRKFEIKDFKWDEKTVVKIITKHNVFPDEVEEVFFNPHFKIKREGKIIRGYGQTFTGRYLFIVFRYQEGIVKIITARGITKKEKKYYRR